MKVTLNEDEIAAACIEWLHKNHGVVVNASSIEATASCAGLGAGRFTPQYIEICFDGVSGTPPPQNGPYR